MLPAIAKQPGLLWFVVKDSCVERLFVCTSVIVDHDELALVRPAVPLEEDPAAVGAALLLEICSLLQPAQFFKTVPELCRRPRCPSTLRRSWP